MRGQSNKNNSNWKGGTSFCLWEGELRRPQEVYEKLFERQNGVCAICGKSESAKRSNSDGSVRKLSIDHDHGTDEVRGLLCSKCNTGIGLFMEDSNLLLKAVEYLK